MISKKDKSKKQEIFSYNFFPRNRRGDIPITILVIGIILVCILALISFLSSTTKVKNSFVGIGVLEKMNMQIEKNYFYKESGFVVGGSGDINSLFNYAKENDVNERRCNCESNCDSYANMVVRASSENGIPDPLLLLSLMMQESTCVPGAFSGSSVGLMQINLMHCGKYGLPLDEAECKKKLIEDAQLNIDVGAKILKESYDTNKKGRTFQGCSLKDITYYEWEAALRGYNGWGCGKDAAGNVFYAQDNYVEEVVNRYETLKGIGSYTDVIRKEGLEITNKFPFIQRKDNFLFSAKFIGP